MEEIKKLRERTGAGMVDCQKALKEANNDLDLAVDILRKKGIAKAAKRGDRETNEGVIKLEINDSATEGYMIELNSETDFVSRNDKFQSLAESILEVVKTKKPQNMEELLSLPLNDLSVKESVDNLSGTIGEKMAIKNFAIVEGKTVAVYSHLGGKIGVLVSLDKEDQKDLAYDVAMQIAAANPRFIEVSDVEATDLQKEREINKEMLLKEGKPEAMIEKILDGKMGKYYSEVCLVEQEYIKDDKKKMKDILGDVKVLKFVRFTLSN